MMKKLYAVLLLSFIVSNASYALIGDVVSDVVGGAANVAGAAVDTVGNVAEDVVGPRRMVYVDQPGTVYGGDVVEVPEEEQMRIQPYEEERIYRRPNRSYYGRPYPVTRTRSWRYPNDRYVSEYERHLDPYRINK